MADLKSSLGEKFIVKIENTEVTDKVIALVPAYFKTLALVEGAPNVIKYNGVAEIVQAGFACDAALDDGIISGAGANAVTVTSANSKMTVRAFLEYIKNNSRVVKAMSVSASNTNAFDQTMEVVYTSPLTGARTSYISLGLLRDRYTTLGTVLDVDTEGLVLSFESLVLLPVPAGTTITISFLF